MKHALLLAALLAGATAANADTVANIVERAKLEIQPSGRAFTKVTIDNPLGDVEIVGYDGTSIQIETKKTGPDDEAIERLRISLVPNPDGTVRITTTADRDKESKPLLRSAVRIDLKVRAPRNARVEATASAGRLAMKDMDAGGDLDTASGKIDVQNVAGELSTHSISGDTSLAKVFGSVDTQSLQADLDLDSISGEKLVASASGRGKIAGRRVRSREIQMSASDGKITLEADATLRGRLVVSSLSGNIDVRLHRRGNAVTIRAKGNKVDLGLPTQTTSTDGWASSSLGNPSNAAAMVEMRSRYGFVQFAIIE